MKKDTEIHYYNNGLITKKFKMGTEPSGFILGKLKYKKLEDVNFEDITSYYKAHTDLETCQKFKIQRHQLQFIMKTLGLNKSPEEINSARNRRNLEKYGYENVFQVPENINKIKDTKIEKYGSLKAAYHERNLKTIETIQKRYQDNTITNVFQLDFVKEKSNVKLAEPFNGNCQAAKSFYAKKGNDTKEKKYGYRGVNQTPEVIHKKKKRYTFNGIQFDSSWELAVYIYAIDHNENIIYHNIDPFYYYVDNKKYKYYPDFNYKNQLIEIKCDKVLQNNTMINLYDSTDFETRKAAAKYQCMLDSHVAIWTYKDIKYAINYINTTYGKNYLKTFKNN